MRAPPACANARANLNYDDDQDAIANHHTATRMQC